MSHQRVISQTKLKHPAFVLVFVITVIWLTLHLFFVGNLNDRNSAGMKQQSRELQIRYATASNGSDGGLVSFKACNGFANQRLSILYGVLIALRMRRTLVLPRLPLDGTQQKASMFVDGTNSNSERYSNIYDLNMLKSLLQNYKLQVWELDDLPNVKFYEAKCGKMELSACINKIEGSTKVSDTHINFGCTFPNKIISQEYLLQHEDVVKKILDLLIPAPKYEKYVNQIINAIRTNNSNNNNQQDFKFNLVHLRAENDWIDHCQRWEHIKDGIVRDNCFNNTENLGQQLVLKQVDNTIPLYIATQASKIDEQLLYRIKQNLMFNGYSQVLMRGDLNLRGEIEQLPREVAALVDFFVAMSAEQFVGNSVSTFSALILLEREQQGKWAAYYNGGNIPLANFLPLYKVPWVMYSACDTYEFFKHNTLAAIQSAILFGNVDLHLYCVSNTIEKHVQDLINTLKIGFITKNRIQNYIRNPNEIRNIVTLSALVNLEEFAKFNYVVFSGPRLHVRKRVLLDNFKLPLPTEITEYSLSDDSFSWIMMVNSGFIRKGFSSHGLNFMDTLVESKMQVQQNLQLVEGLQNISLKQFPVVISFGQLSIGDLEIYLVTGVCPLKKENSCERVLLQGCRYILEFFVLSTRPDIYPQTLMYCNRLFTVLNHQ